MEYTDPRIHSYLPSLQPMWVDALQRHFTDFRTRTPHKSFSSLKEFNFYCGDKGARFHHPFALYSAGHAELDLDKAVKKDAILFGRNRFQTFLLSDSGGFQVGEKQWKLKDLAKKREQVLRWQEAISDLAIILDVPAWTKGMSFSRALELTQENLRYYADNATGEIPFLNVIHGRDFDQAVQWYEQTRWFNQDGPGVGWCFAGQVGANFHCALKMILYMMSSGDAPRYFHFLGNGTPQSAALYYTLRKLLGRAYETLGLRGRREPVVVTQDAASEFVVIGRYGSIYQRLAVRKGSSAEVSPFVLTSTYFESQDPTFIRHDQFYPDTEGPVLGRPKGVRYGDIINHGYGEYNQDPISHLILIAHNVWAKLDAMDRTLDFERKLRRLTYGKRNQETYELADTVQHLVERLLGMDDGRHGADLVAVTIGLWDLFVDDFDPNDSFEQRCAKLDRFKTEALRIFDRSKGAASLDEKVLHDV